MFQIFQRFLAVIQTLIAILLPGGVRSVSPSPGPLAAVSPTETPLPGFTALPASPSVSPVPSSSPNPQPTDSLIEQLKQLNDAIAKFTPEPSPGLSVTPNVVPSPMPTQIGGQTPVSTPTPLPIMRLKAVMTQDDLIYTPGDTRIGTLTILITDKDGNPSADTDGLTVNMVTGDRNSLVFPEQPITENPFTVAVNKELADHSRLSFGWSTPRDLYYKIIDATGVQIQIQSQ